MAALVSEMWGVQVGGGEEEPGLCGEHVKLARTPCDWVAFSSKQLDTGVFHVML